MKRLFRFNLRYARILMFLYWRYDWLTLNRYSGRLYEAFSRTTGCGGRIFRYAHLPALRCVPFIRTNWINYVSFTVITPPPLSFPCTRASFLDLLPYKTTMSFHDNDISSGIPSNTLLLGRRGALNESTAISSVFENTQVRTRSAVSIAWKIFDIKNRL